MLYDVYYKKPDGLIWHKIKNVEGDTIIESANGMVLPARVLFLADKTRIEIPMTFLIKFSKERFFDVEENMEKESGQKVKIDKKSKLLKKR